MVLNIIFAIADVFFAINLAWAFLPVEWTSIIGYYFLARGIFASLRRFIISGMPISIRAIIRLSVGFSILLSISIPFLWVILLFSSFITIMRGFGMMLG